MLHARKHFANFRHPGLALNVVRSDVTWEWTLLVLQCRVLIAKW